MESQAKVVQISSFVGCGFHLMLRCRLHLLNFTRFSTRTTATIIVSDIKYALPREEMTLLQVLRHHRFPMEFDCQKGSCKKCSIEVELEGTRAEVLACQELARDGMQVFTQRGPDESASLLCEREAREQAQKQMLARRAKKTAGPPKAAKPIDRRERLEEVIRIQEFMASGEEPEQLLKELREFLEGLPGSRFWDVEQTCKLDAWIKKRSWGRAKRQAEKLRYYIQERLTEESAAEVETLAC